MRISEESVENFNLSIKQTQKLVKFKKNDMGKGHHGFFASAASSKGFGRMFPSLDKWEADLDKLKKEFKKYVAFSFDDKAGLPAGYTYFGQLIAHDLSFDVSSVDDAPIELSSLINLRTPLFDLDTMYGGGPDLNPHLYDSEKASFILQEIQDPSQSNRLVWDVPRNKNGVPIIADKRNNENAIIAQLHIAFLLLHNKFVQQLKISSEMPLTKSELFIQAKNETLRHYQWVVVYDYLCRITNTSLEEMQNLIKSELQKKAINSDVHFGLNQTQKRIKKTLENIFNTIRKHFPEFTFKSNLFDLFVYRIADIFIPIEFSTAAFRFGHSQVRLVYDFNERALQQALSLESVAMTQMVDWSAFFFLNDFMGKNVNISSLKNKSNAIDIVFTIIFDRQIKLILNDIKRGIKMGIPSGQSIAKYLEIEPLSEAEWIEVGKKLDVNVFDNKDQDVLKFKEDAPLLYYVLAEAFVKGEHGKYLGPVGSNVVTQTIIGLLLADENSILNTGKDWRPAKEHCNTKGEFGMIELLKLAGVYHGALVNPPSQTP